MTYVCRCSAKGHRHRLISSPMIDSDQRDATYWISATATLRLWVASHYGVVRQNSHVDARSLSQMQHINDWLVFECRLHHKNAALCSSELTNDKCSGVSPMSSWAHDKSEHGGVFALRHGLNGCCRQVLRYTRRANGHGI